MKIGSPAWRRMIQDGGQKMGSAVSRVELDQLAEYTAELIRWNRKTNLTAIVAPGDIAVKHVIDSFAPLPHISQGAALLDIGSGGGFPGMVLKIVRADISTTLIDASRKKVSFLSHIIRTLGLKNIVARHIRAEDLVGSPTYDHPFDVIVCRALCALPAFLAMASPLLAPGGRLIALKGRIEEAESEILKLSSATPPDVLRSIEYGNQRWSLTTEIYPLPYTDTQRTLIIIQRY